MDLLSYLRRRRRRIEALLLVPVVAIAVTVAMTLQSPDRYAAEASLTMTAPEAGFRAARVDAAAAFARAWGRDEVVAAAAEQAGVSPAELDAAVSVRADGEVVVVAAETTRPGSTAAGMVEAVLGAGLGEVYAPASATARAALDVATERGAEAESALDAFEAERGQVGVLVEHEALVASLGDLRAQRAVARADGRVQEVAALTELIDEGDRRRLELEPLLPDYRRLSAALDRADAQITDAQRTLDDLRATEQGARDEAARVVGDVQQVSVMDQLGQRILAAAAIGLLVAAAALGALEVLRPVDDDDAAHSALDDSDVSDEGWAEPDRGATGVEDLDTTTSTAPRIEWSGARREPVGLDVPG